MIKLSPLSFLCGLLTFHNSPFNETDKVNDKDSKTLGTRALDWHIATSILSHVSCDVIQILDCCYCDGTKESGIETLAATMESAGNKETDTSFLKAFITTLEKLFTSPFTIADVYERMLQDRMELQLKHVPFYKNDRKDPIIFGTPKSEGRNAVSEPKPDDVRVLVTIHVDENLSESDVEELKS